MSLLRLIPVKVIASGVALTGGGYLGALLVGTDGTNDVTISLYDSASAASGDELAPTQTIDGDSKRYNGFNLGGGAVYFENGVYVDVTCSGSFEIFLYTRQDTDISIPSLAVIRRCLRFRLFSSHKPRTDRLRSTRFTRLINSELSVRG